MLQVTSDLASKLRRRHLECIMVFSDAFMAKITEATTEMLRQCLILLVCLSLSFGCKADDKLFAVISINLKQEKLELFLNDEDGKPFNRLDHLAAWLKSHNRQLIFAMNAGMYQPNFSPVGLLVINGKQVSPLNQADGTGNFFLKPNGVFLVSKSKPAIVDSVEYPTIAKGVQIATQSGPLLLRRGVIHPAFNPQSSSRLIRNGVGVSGSNVYFVMSKQPVSFYEMAIFFRKSLRCQDALYLDGVVSSLYSNGQIIGNDEADIGPIVGVAQ